MFRPTYPQIHFPNPSSAYSCHPEYVLAPGLILRAQPHGARRVNSSCGTDISASLPPLLPTLSARACTLQGRELGDVALAVRAVSVGFLGEAVVASKKSGRAGIEEVERWWLSQKDREWSARPDCSPPPSGSPLVLHIEQAQLVPSNVLAELSYILGLHPDLPIRVLLSVPSISTFLANWTNIEPSMVHLTVMDSGKGRKRAGGVNAILRVGTVAPSYTH